MEDENLGNKIFITNEEWEEKLQSVIVRKELMNKIVMNFMDIQEHVDVAQTFCDESGTALDREAIIRRLDVKKAVQDGAVGNAIEKVNHLYPGILDSNISLCFHLLQQHILELVGQEKQKEALDIAEEKLAPLGVGDADLLNEIEKTVSLLAFQNPQESPFADLLDVQRRLNTAIALNTAILIFQGQEKDSWLSLLCKCIAWAEFLLNEKAVFPRTTATTPVDPLTDPDV